VKNVYEHPGPPWEPQTRKFSNGTMEEGWTTPILLIAIVDWRSTPFILVDAKDEHGNIISEDRKPKKVMQFLPHNTPWREGMQYYTEAIMFAQGFGSPVIWSCKGLTSKAFNQNILTPYVNGMLRNAGRKVNRQLPLWTFWLPVGTKMNGDEVVYEDTGHGSTVTPPALRYDVADDEHDLFIGRDVFQDASDLYEELHRRGWKEEREQYWNTLSQDEAVAAGIIVEHPRPALTDSSSDDLDEIDAGIEQQQRNQRNQRNPVAAAREQRNQRNHNSNGGSNGSNGSKRKPGKNEPQPVGNTEIEDEIPF
jgi:hypothetical protein